MLACAVLLAGGAALCGKPPTAGEQDPYVSQVAGTMPEDFLPALKRMIADAVKQSPQMIASELDIDISNAQERYNGLAPMLPQVGGTVQYGTNISAVANDPSAGTRNSGFYFDVNAHQMLFAWGQLRDKLQQSHIQVLIAERQYATAYQQFVVGLRRQFLSLIAQKIQLRNYGFSLSIANKALAAAQERFKAGAVPPGALQGAQLDQQDAQLAYDEAVQGYEFARRQLARQVGQMDIPDADIPANFPAPKYSQTAASELLADLLRTGARYTPDAQTSLLQVRYDKLDYDWWKVNLLPRLSFQADANQSNQLQTNNGQVQQTAILNEDYYLHADWNIFDGLATRAHKEEALINRRRAERQLQIRADQTMDQAQNAERQVEFQWRSLQIANERDVISRSQLDRALQEQKHGAGSEESVAAARSAVYSSEYGVASLRSAFLSAWCDFVGLTGHDPALNNLPYRYVRPVP